MFPGGRAASAARTNTTSRPIRKALTPLRFGTSVPAAAISRRARPASISHCPCPSFKKTCPRARPVPKAPAGFDFHLLPRRIRPPAGYRTCRHRTCIPCQPLFPVHPIAAMVLASAAGSFRTQPPAGIPRQVPAHPPLNRAPGAVQESGVLQRRQEWLRTNHDWITRVVRSRAPSVAWLVKAAAEREPRDTAFRTGGDTGAEPQA